MRITYVWMSKTTGQRDCVTIDFDAKTYNRHGYAKFREGHTIAVERRREILAMENIAENEGFKNLENMDGKK
jgi:hypothetical protein